MPGRAVSRRLALLLGLLAPFALIGFAASPAAADTTHKYLGQLTLASGGNPQPEGIDSEGNIIVWLEDQEVVAKFDTDGNPVNFSALGTNMIDGAGTLECPTIPTDCDRVPAGKLGPYGPGSWDDVVQVDASGGATDGHIYVRTENSVTQTGEVVAFNSSGKYIGTINELQANPWQDATKPADGLAIAPNGTLYITRHDQNSSEGDGGHVDRYAPVDANPARHVFTGQLRFAYQYLQALTLTAIEVMVTNNDGVFACCGGTWPDSRIGHWRWYDSSEFERPYDGSKEFAMAKDYLPFPAANSGTEFCSGCLYDVGAVNPVTGNIQLMGEHHPGISIWDETAHRKVGPTIGRTPPETGNGGRSFAFDTSDGPNRGGFYVKGGSNSLSIFSPALVIPDIEVTEPVPGHKSATIKAEVGPAGGPTVTGCEVEFGITESYGTTVPCSPAPPYSGNTQVSAEFAGLFTETDYHYKIKATNANGLNETLDNVVHTVAVLALKTGPATDLGETSATLTGSLDADGMPATYHFQYGIGTIYDLETPSASAGSGTGSAAVTPVTIDQLQPGRLYHYRLVAENSLGTTFGADRTFTAPAKPLAFGLHSTNVLEKSAVVHAQLKNFDSPTEYFFEYGTSLAYGSSTPVESLPADAAVQDVSAHLSGLSGGTTVHYRLVATNQYGTTKSRDATFEFSPPACPNALVRQQVGANTLPDCRAYELVSPARAGSIILFPGDFISQLAPTAFTEPKNRPRYTNAGYASTPSRFGFYGGLGGLAGVDAPNVLFDHYVATRTGRGWNTTFPGTRAHESTTAAKGECSSTMDKCIDYPMTFALSIYPPTTAPFPSVWDISGRFLGRWPTNLEIVPGADHLTGDSHPSPDFSHFVFTSRDLAFTPGGLTSAPGSVYDNDVGRGHVEIVSKLANGDPIPQDTGGEEEVIKVQAISTTGSHILMSTAATGGTVNLYMRVGGAVTYEISGGIGAELIGMSKDGSTVAFISDFRLTPEDTDDSKDLYMWEEDTAATKLVSQGNGRGNSNSCQATWTQNCSVAAIAPERPDIDDVMAANGDVYFYSPEQLDASDPGVLNQRNLYHLHNGQLQYVTTFEPDTQANRMQISADGEHAAFLTRSALTGYNNSYIDNFAAERRALEMFAFDATGREVQCASCNPSGQPPEVLRPEPPGNEVGTTTADVKASQSGPFMSDDGRVAFATNEALVPRDANGIIDVYEFTGSEVRLISSGTGTRFELPRLALFYPSQTIGLEAFSRDGVDLYFSTFDTLVPEDENGKFIKFYDARTGGGFPANGRLLPCEAADECHGPTSDPVRNPEVGTGVGYGVAGNVPQTRKGKHRRKKARNHKRRRGKHRAAGHRRVHDGGSNG